MSLDLAAIRARVVRLERELRAAEAKSARASQVRAALPAGSTRARVTTANARWARAAEYRDLVASQLTTARVEWDAALAAHNESREPK